MSCSSSVEGRKKLSDWLFLAEVENLPEFFACITSYHNWFQENQNSFDVLYIPMDIQSLALFCLKKEKRNRFLYDILSFQALFFSIPTIEIEPKNKGFLEQQKGAKNPLFYVDRIIMQIPVYRISDRPVSIYMCKGIKPAALSYERSTRCSIRGDQSWARTEPVLLRRS